MAKKKLTRSEETFKRLSASGRYVSTGKVLIGVAHCPRPRDMTHNELLIQDIILGTRRWHVTTSWLCYVAVLAVMVGVFFAFGLLK
jgi:hypothetical protein